MRRLERGIGNMAFIAVLTLLIVAVAMFFLKNNDLTKAQESRDSYRKKWEASSEALTNAGKAYDEWVAISGLTMPELQRQAGTDATAGLDTYPEPKVIQEKVRTWLMTQVTDIEQKSVARLNARQYRVESGTTVIKVQPGGDKTTITLFGSPFVAETITWQAFVAPIGEQFAYAVKVIQANNDQFESNYAANETRFAELQKRVNEISSQFQTDVAGKQQLLDTEKANVATLQDKVNAGTTEIDALNGKLQQLQTTYAKDMRTKDRNIQALSDRVRLEREKMAIAMKEDPSDGEVLVSDPKQKLCFLDKGRDFHMSTGTKFKIWRMGRGNLREDIAEVEVIDVGATSSTARIIKQINGRIPVAREMNYSSPFYDAHRKLRVHIFGNLRYYPSDLAKRRLAEAGCEVAERLDDTVQIIVLGEPAVDISAEAATPEDAAQNEERAKVQREARIREVKDLAATLGAVVVTEDVLRTFIQY